MHPNVETLSCKKETLYKSDAETLLTFSGPEKLKCKIVFDSNGCFVVKKKKKKEGQS